MRLRNSHAELIHFMCWVFLGADLLYIVITQEPKEIPVKPSPKKKARGKVKAAAKKHKLPHKDKYTSGNS